MLKTLHVHTRMIVLSYIYIHGFFSYRDLVTFWFFKWDFAHFVMTKKIARKHFYVEYSYSVKFIWLLIKLAYMDFIYQFLSSDMKQNHSIFMFSPNHIHEQPQIADSYVRYFMQIKVLSDKGILQNVCIFMHVHVCIFLSSWDYEFFLKF